jgi:hypothetical protein
VSVARSLSKLVVLLALAGAGAVAIAARVAHDGAPAPAPGSALPPATLAETGLYADPARGVIAPAVRPFVPQYPLWTDGARKRRWILLPPGTSIDARDPDAWQFPAGTRLWKEFAFGARVETRYMERTTTGWLYATYVWDAEAADARRATLAPSAGAWSAALAPGVRHRIPSEADCRACHDHGRSPVLGFSALQISDDRDPNAPHREPEPPGTLGLAELIDRDLVRGAPATWRTTPPRIPGPPITRAALGYLHGNCGGCHRGDGPLASLELVLAYSVEHGSQVAETTRGRAGRFGAPAVRVAPGQPAVSVLHARMRSRAPATQMPPLGTALVDDEATSLIADWITQLAEQTPGETR